MTALLALTATASGPVAPAGRALAAEAPSASVSSTTVALGETVTVSGAGWRPDTLLTVLLCGQNRIGGSASCANAHGRAVTTRADGSFSRELPVGAPPKPCPCVVHVATVTGEPASAEAELAIAGHPVAALPPDPGQGGGRLSVLEARLEGESGLLTWFGAPARRTVVLVVGNVGSAPLRDPVFRVGTAHGVFAPDWEEHRWRGTVPAGQRARIAVPVQLPAGAHGDYLVSLTYGGKVLTEQPWGVGRPWGVTLFWVLLCAVVPAALFRVGMAVVDRVRPRPAAEPATEPATEAAAEPTSAPDKAPAAAPGPGRSEPAGSPTSPAPPEGRPCRKESRDDAPEGDRGGGRAAARRRGRRGGEREPRPGRRGLLRHGVPPAPDLRLTADPGGHEGGTPGSGDREGR
ncbi:neocarzinostatin apoprotein domain-containing protein [Streptomyces sp. URMC 123]|uniref:neocarzinostatin apoprotein domain-containing protein n=1 Tax=Streptomyces sp. URMC 123 TaxID=3423403 RepID=UPI003F53A87B